MKKKKYKIKCGCGEQIIGFSERHARVNLDIHRKTSIFHKKVMKVLKDRGVRE